MDHFHSVLIGIIVGPAVRDLWRGFLRRLGFIGATQKAAQKALPLSRSASRKRR